MHKFTAQQESVARVVLTQLLEFERQRNPSQVRVHNLRGAWNKGKVSISGKGDLEFLALAEPPLIQFSADTLNPEEDRVYLLDDGRAWLQLDSTQAYSASLLENNILRILREHSEYPNEVVHWDELVTEVRVSAPALRLTQRNAVYSAVRYLAGKSLVDVSAVGKLDDIEDFFCSLTAAGEDYLRTLDNRPPQEIRLEHQESEDDPTGEGISEEDTSFDLDHPFDPSQIKVSLRSVGVYSLMERVRHNEINLKPEFQRQSGLWKTEAKCRLIESLLIAIPLPTFYFDATDENYWVVVDGLQRLTTMKEFILQETLPLQGLEFLTQFHGLYYRALPRQFQRRIQETEVQVCLIDPGTPEQVKFNIFKRINTGGLPATFQEIRHALYLGRATSFLERLVSLPEFQEATDRGIRDQRRQAQELVLRAIAFTLQPPELYPQNQDLDSFLNATMDKLNSLSEATLEDIERNFARSMSLSFQIFGRDAFRKRTNDSDQRKPISKALFETWTVNLGQLNEVALHMIVAKRNTVREKFQLLLRSNTRFLNSISIATGNAQKVRYRFAEIKHIIRESLNA